MPVIMTLLFAFAVACSLALLFAALGTGMYFISVQMESNPTYYRSHVLRAIAALMALHALLAVLRLVAPASQSPVPIPLPRLLFSFATHYLLRMCASNLPFLSLNPPLVVASGVASLANVYSLCAWARGSSNTLRFTHGYLGLGPIILLGLAAPMMLLAVSTASDLVLSYGDTMIQRRMAANAAANARQSAGASAAAADAENFAAAAAGQQRGAEPAMRKECVMLASTSELPLSFTPRPLAAAAGSTLSSAVTTSLNSVRKNLTPLLLASRRGVAALTDSPSLPLHYAATSPVVATQQRVR